MKKFSVPDRRDLVQLKTWCEQFADLFDRIKKEGGKAYMDQVDSLDQHRESVTLYGRLHVEL